jgi:S1-C subfamily serine protease
MIKKLSLIIFIIISFSSNAFAGEKSGIIVKNAKKSVVRIFNNITKSAHSYNSKISGTGFVVNKKLGIILTNEHIASSNRINNLSIVFFDGREVEGKFIYSDATVDFAFLRVDPKSIPEEVNELKFSKDIPRADLPIFIIGNSENQGLSWYTGSVSNRYGNSGFFPSQDLLISTTVKGGSSGSPIVNWEGEALGILYSRANTYAYAVAGNYITDALKEIENNKLPTRKSTGALLDYYSIDRAVKYFKLPATLTKGYTKKHPHAFNQLLKVDRVFKDSPAYSVLKAGDIIWEVNGKEIGPEMYQLQKAFNDAKTNITELTIYRNGKKLRKKVGLYEVNKTKPNRMVVFGGATFYEADEFIRLLTGAALGTVVVTNIDNGSSFDVLPMTDVRNFLGTFRVHSIKALDEFKIQNLDDLIQVIPALAKRKNFALEYNNRIFSTGFDGMPQLNKGDRYIGIDFYNYDSLPTLLTWKNGEWQTTKLN